MTISPACGAAVQTCCCYSVGIIAVTIGALGLAGALSLKAASIGALFSGPLAFIPGIVGLCGATALPIVSGVTLGSGLLSFMVGSCCASCALFRRSSSDLTL